MVLGFGVGVGRLMEAVGWCRDSRVVGCGRAGSEGMSGGWGW